MTEILFIRHGETAWNAMRRLQGHSDVPLNAEGTRQAKALAASLQNEKLHAIISSDLQRAVQTAGEIARLQGISTRLDSDLRERNFGGFEGKLYSELPELYPDAYREWRLRDPDFHFPAPPEDDQYTGESIREFHTRTMACIKHHAQFFEGQKIAIVAHGGVLECAYREATGLPLNAERKITIYNGSINRFAWKNGCISLVNWGEIAHLDDAALEELS